MNILDALWKRLLISFFLGVMVSKALAQLTFEKVEISRLLFTVIFYFVLTRLYEKSVNATQNENEK